MAVITGTNAKNILNGTALADTLRGLGGNDTLKGLGGEAGDAVVTDDDGWGAGVVDADNAGYTTSTNGAAKLIVDSDITRTDVQA
jgi:hypothetical protein